jgi:glyoxylase-like metal-dependent hydrolase (beta-lactamase superfamily II)
MRRLAEGVWQLPGWFHLVNCYLVRTEEGDVLIDGGTRWATRRVLHALSDTRLSLVALTHVHPDHQGAVAAVCRRHGVPLACHEDDADVMEGKAPMRPDNWLVRAGHPLMSGPPHPVARRLRDGDAVGEWRVVHTPGHTAGHVVYFRDRDRVAIAGDVVRNSFLPWGTPAQPPRLFSADAGRNRRSVRTLLDLRPSLICFGHGAPLADLTRLERLAARLGV